jgi:hypothetical protein
MPTSASTRASLPLTWGSFRGRSIAGLVLAITGAVHVQGTNTYSLPVLLVGVVAVAVGWGIMPARGWRRLIAAPLGIANAVALLAGPVAVWTCAFALLAWLLVRQRPPLSYLALLFPIANGLVLPRLFEDYGWMPLCLAISLAVVVASAWIAGLIADSGRRPSPPAAAGR